jgi:hypothetical protein
MPQAYAYFATWVAGFFSTWTGATIAYYGAYTFAYAASMTALNSVSRSLTQKKPRGAGRGLELTYAETDGPLVILYGEARLGGLQSIPYLLSGQSNEDLHYIITHVGHEACALGEAVFDDA